MFRNVFPLSFVALYLTVQIAVPTAQLARPRPARFGWQMYAGMAEPVSFTAVRSDGSRGQVDMSRYLANHRGDIAVSQIIPPAVCEREPGILEVHYRIVPESSDRVFRCAR